MTSDSVIVGDVFADGFGGVYLFSYDIGPCLGDPMQMLLSMDALIHDLALNRGAKTSLHQKCEVIAQSLERGDLTPACKVVDALLAQLNHLDADNTPLAGIASDLYNTIGC